MKVKMLQKILKSTIENARNISVKADTSRMLLPFSVTLTAQKKSWEFDIHAYWQEKWSAFAFLKN